MSSLALGSFGQLSFIPSNQYGQTLEVNENLTKIAGPHTLKMGFEYQPMNFPTLSPTWPRGILTYNGEFTSVVNKNDGSTAMAQLLLKPEAATVPKGTMMAVR